MGTLLSRQAASRICLDD